MTAHRIIDRREILTSAEVIALIPDLGPATPVAPVMGEAAAPDVPAAVGAMIVAAYATIIAAFFIGFARAPDSTMMVVISALFTAVYLSVAGIMLRVEGASGKLSLRQFMQVGLNTWTGHLSGAEAIVQMLLIPAAIATAVFAIGIVAAVTL